MSFVSFALPLILVGVGFWLEYTYFPRNGTIRRVLNGAVSIAVVLWLLYAFGVLGHGPEIHASATR